MSGFSKDSGPTGASASRQLGFGGFTAPSSPPFPHYVPARSSRGVVATGGVRSPPLVYDSLIYESSDFSASSAQQPSGVPRRPGTAQRVRSPSFSFERTQPTASSPYSNAGAHRPSVSPQWLNGQRSLVNEDNHMNQRPSAVTSFVASRNSGTSVTANVSRFQDLKRTRSPPLPAWDEEISRDSNRTLVKSHSDDNGNHVGPESTTTASLPFQNDKFIVQAHCPDEVQQRPLSQFSNGNPNLLARKDDSSALTNVDSRKCSRNFVNEVAGVRAAKLTKTARIPSVKQDFQIASKRLSASPPWSVQRSDARTSPSSCQMPQTTIPSTNFTSAEVAQTRTPNYSVAKRTRSPPLHAADKALGISNFVQDDTEREVEAKAKRLARFKEELSENFENGPDIAKQNTYMSRREQSVLEREKFVGSHSMQSAIGLTNDNVPSDLEESETSCVIIGLCPDMCPVSEREERERKGDLDRYERLDGDRNQTTKFLAVKKYNRTAEREANLIRPMAVLQKTIDYLLNLLDEPYADRFLGMYNFLWDRMRAIRMDLRMQHLFNLDAIAMLEQMIRLHIIAMHELCEYTKGEGFSEGFDAHLNIEQMNKTSVELFQMYDDHRKKGISVPTEKEFRGYYALLKLDKHPGYKVEPAELSLDLSKMTPDIRQTPEVLFARDVARACRTGNFIAFFRLARKATYLQSCLMHAHFAKLRTQALASLHSGLPYNQGIPVSDVAKWLAMEEEDIESLLDYHGFSIKAFEEPYMVKEGPFANSDQDYPTKLSKLVHLKRSTKIADDVTPPSEVMPLPTCESKGVQRPKIYKLDKKTVPSTLLDAKSSTREIDEELPDIRVASTPKVVPCVQPMVEKSKSFKRSQDHRQVGSASYVSPWGFSLAHTPPVFQPTIPKGVETLNKDVARGTSAEKKIISGMESMPQVVPRTSASMEKSPSAKYVESTIPHFVASNISSKEGASNIIREGETDEVMENFEDEAVAQAKLKLIIRLWKRRALKQRELREQRQIEADAALSSLSLGPPVRLAKDQQGTANEFDVEHVIRERYEKHDQSWLRLNVSDVTADILCERNSDLRCLCWKVVVYSPGDELAQRSKVTHSSLGPWLLSKLMPSTEDGGDDLLISSSDLSIWKKWIPSQSPNDLTCCLSVVRRASFDCSNETVDGASAILFLVSESIPWKAQKAHFQKLLMSIASGSSLPLLVLCDSYSKEASDPYNTIVSELGLGDIDKSLISSFLVVFLAEDQEKQYLDGFFSDVRLREGLQWLASESPLLPEVSSINTRDLILTYLDVSLDVLEWMNVQDLSPNHCISTFNEALDWSIGEITAAADLNSINWPCPEISLLPESCDEHMAVKWYLPSIGWSSAAKIEPLLSALRESKLPPLSDDISWSQNGAESGDEIEDLRSQLENCLIRYLTEPSGLMTINLAIKEAYVMLQKSARLELHESRYYIVPNWIKIFRRIINWRLTSLSRGILSCAYVLRHHHVDPMERIPNEFQLEADVSSPYLSQPSLDEIISGSISPPKPISDRPRSEAFQSSTVLSYGDVWLIDNVDHSMEDERMCEQIVTGSSNNGTMGSDITGTEVTVTGRTTGQTEKLSKLLEHCNILQNSIEEKLFIYF